MLLQTEKKKVGSARARAERQQNEAGRMGQAEWGSPNAAIPNGVVPNAAVPNGAGRMGQF